jgi:hypothetical protein
VRGVDLLGWSFPGRQHRGDPLLAPGLADALAGRREGAALLGVLHTDLDATSSPYAPTRRRDLTALPVDRWFLGHVHQPSDLAAGDRCGYLGSLVGLDPAETGRRGAWLVAAAGPGQVAAEPVSLGPVCWLSLDVDVSDLSLGDAAEDDLHQALERAFRRAQAADPALAAGDLEAVGVSVRWTGRCARRDALVGFEGLIRDAGRALHVGAQVWAAVDFADATRPAHDLPSLAREVTPAGALAALLLDLDERGEVAIPAPVRRRFAEQAAAPWGLVDGAAPPPDLLALTRRAALEALDALLAQREA